MAYRWGQEGPAFEFTTPYATENRFLKLRAYLLVSFSVVVMLVLAVVPQLGLTPSTAPSGLDAPLGAPLGAPLPLTIDGSTAPAELSLNTLDGGTGSLHLVVALLMGVFGVLDFLRLRRQQTLLLTPGQPASLITEVQREAVGLSAGLSWLTQRLRTGMPTPLQPAGRYRRLLRALLPADALAPQTLYGWLQLRLSHGLLVLGVGLLLLGGWFWISAPTGRALLGLWCAALVLLVVVRSRLGEEKVALTPAALAAVWLLGAAGVVCLALLSPRLAESTAGVRWGFPIAAAGLLLGLGALELLALLAGRVHADGGSPPASRAETTVTVDAAGDPQVLMQELDRELLRRWTEGVPNRRYAWQIPQIDAQAAAGSFSATMLEESQPVAASGGNQMTGLRRQGPLLLDVIGLLFTLGGALLWLWLSYQHGRNGGTFSWTLGSVALVCFALGAHALHLGHLLWSRIEVESIFTWLQFDGRFVRAGNVLASDGVVLQAQVMRARAVFYAAAPHPADSRVLLRMAGDSAGAEHWAQWLRDHAQGPRPLAARTAPAVAPAEAAMRPRPPAPPPAVATVGAEPARGVKAPRYCPACATPVLQGARFCQHCGNALTPG